MDIEWLRSHAQRTPETEKRFEQLNQLLDEAVSLKRRVIEDLRPSLLDNLGLGPALEWHVTEHCKKGGLICKLDLADTVDTFDADTSIALYRIVQEALTNVLRHAKATRFELSLHTTDEDILLTMRDNGVGLPPTFNPAKLSHGLSGMRQRARALGGEVSWESAPRQGTRIKIRIPLQPAVPAAPRTGGGRGHAAHAGPARPDPTAGNRPTSRRGPTRQPRLASPRYPRSVFRSHAFRRATDPCRATGAGPKRPSCIDSTPPLPPAVISYRP